MEELIRKKLENLLGLIKEQVAIVMIDQHKKLEIEFSLFFSILCNTNQNEKIKSKNHGKPIDRATIDIPHEFWRILCIGFQILCNYKVI